MSFSTLTMSDAAWDYSSDSSADLGTDDISKVAARVMQQAPPDTIADIPLEDLFPPVASPVRAPPHVQRATDATHKPQKRKFVQGTLDGTPLSAAAAAGIPPPGPIGVANLTQLAPVTLPEPTDPQAPKRRRKVADPNAPPRRRKGSKPATAQSQPTATAAIETQRGVCDDGAAGDAGMTMCGATAQPAQGTTTASLYSLPDSRAIDADANEEYISGFVYDTLASWQDALPPAATAFAVVRIARRCQASQSADRTLHGAAHRDATSDTLVPLGNVTAETSIPKLVRAALSAVGAGRADRVYCVVQQTEHRM